MLIYKTIYRSLEIQKKRQSGYKCSCSCCPFIHGGTPSYSVNRHPNSNDHAVLRQWQILYIIVARRRVNIPSTPHRKSSKQASQTRRCFGPGTLRPSAGDISQHGIEGSAPTLHPIQLLSSGEVRPCLAYTPSAGSCSSCTKASRRSWRVHLTSTLYISQLTATVPAPVKLARIVWAHGHLGWRRETCTSDGFAVGVS